jgi:hypothetical protein
VNRIIHTDPYKIGHLFQGALQTTNDPSNADRHLGDAHEDVRKAISWALSRPEKLSVVFSGPIIQSG